MYMLNFVLNETVIVHKDFHDGHATFPRLPKYFKLDLKQTHFFSIAFLNFVQHDILSSQSEQQWNGPLVLSMLIAHYLNAK